MAEKTDERIELGVIGKAPIHIRPGFLGALYHQVIEGRSWSWQRFWFLFRGDAGYYGIPVVILSVIALLVSLGIAWPPSRPEGYDPSFGLALVIGIWAALVLAPLVIEFILYLAFLRLERETEFSQPLIHAAVEKRFDAKTAEETTPHLALGDMVAFRIKLPLMGKQAQFYARIEHEDTRAYLHIWQ